MSNIAIILAGGSGTRLGADRPKQFLEVAGKTIMEHTIEAFHQNANIDEIAIVSREDFVDEVWEMVRKNAYSKVKHVLKGGKERYHSTLAALAAYKNDDDLLLIHDCVRPLVTDRIINDCISALDTYEACCTAVPATDTIVEVNDDECITATPPRSHLRNCQTPQAFRRSTIQRAFDIALSDPDFMATDDCGVVRRYLPDTPVKIVRGETFNIKITYPEDLMLLEHIKNNTCKQ